MQLREANMHRHEMREVRKKNLQIKSPEKEKRKKSKWNEMTERLQFANGETPDQCGPSAGACVPATSCTTVTTAISCGVSESTLCVCLARRATAMPSKPGTQWRPTTLSQKADIFAVLLRWDSDETNKFAWSLWVRRESAVCVKSWQPLDHTRVATEGWDWKQTASNSMDGWGR